MASNVDIVGRGRFATLIARLFRWPVVLLTLAVLAVLLWSGLYPWVTQRRLTFDLTVENASWQWSLRWVRQSNGARNGAWLDVRGTGADKGDGEEWLEIRTSGVSRSADGTFEVWLYHAVPLDSKCPPLDLKAIIAAAGPEDKQGSWEPNAGGDGVVYYGPGPGLLRIRAPVGGIRLHLARLPVSGEVIVTYAGETKTLDLRSSTHDSLTTSFTRKVFVKNAILSVEQTLPNYDLGNVELRWDESESAVFSVSEATLTELIFGMPILRRALEPNAEKGARVVDRRHELYRFETTAAAGSVLFRGRTRFGITVHALGYAITLLSLAACVGTAVLARRLLWRVLAQLRSWPIIAVLLVILARVWMTTWSPFFYSYDSIDYLGNAITLLAKGSFSHFDTVRPPGYSSLLALLISLCDDPSIVLAWTNAAFGAATAFMVYLMLRRFVPSPWPVAGLLLVGLDPILLTYERYALTECLTTLLFTLICCMVTMQVMRDTAHKSRRLAELLSAVVIGLLSVLAIYTRSNLVTLLVLVPVVLLINAARKREGWFPFASPVLVIVLVLVAVLPSAIHRRDVIGRAATSVKPLESLWALGRLDLNQTAFYSREAYERREKAGTEQPDTFWPIYYELAPPGELSGQDSPVKRAVLEMSARRPLITLRTIWESFGYQTGLLLHGIPGGWLGENGLVSRPLRGLPRETNAQETNFVEYTKLSPSYPEVQAAFPNLEQSVTYLRDCGSTAWFDRFYQAFDLLRPVLAFLSVLGVVLALRGRCYGVLALALIVFGNIAALVFLMTPNDRYGVPFKPLIAVMAVYALYRIVQGRRAAASTHAA